MSETLQLVLAAVAAIIRPATGFGDGGDRDGGRHPGRLAADLGTGELSLLVLAIGSGSLIFSHVNDAGSGW
jgi:GntP family gluconate:H+ symporter